MRGGMTSVGSPAVVSNILANSGFMPGTSQYTQTAEQVALAARNYGMENSAAANSITSMSRMDIANNMFNMGMTTLDENGNQLSMGNMSKQLMERMFIGGTGTTAQQLNRSIQYGSLPTQLAGYGITDPNTQQLITNNMMDIANGKNPDAANNSANNLNPTTSLMGMNESQTGILQGSEANALAGLETAAKMVKAFNDTMGPIIESMAKYKAIIEGGMSTNAGRGVQKAASTFFQGFQNVVGGLTNILTLGMVDGGGGTPGYGAAIGGGTPGFGSSTNKNNFGKTNAIFGSPLKGATAPGSTYGLVSAGYGVEDSSGIWNSTGGKHQGIDTVAPIGTPVHATKEGVVSGKVLSADYGQAVVLEHKDGWSSIYAHLSSKDVSIGTLVNAGDIIGKTGVSGNVTGPSLHYEVWHGDNNPVDPSTFDGAFSSPINLSALADVPGDAGTNGQGKPQGKGGSTVRAVNPKAGNAGDQEFAKALLTKLSIPITPQNTTALTTWMHWEGGTKNNAFNPMNTTYEMPGSTDFNSVGVQSYVSLTQGVDATYNTLTGKSAKERGYTAIVEALRTNAPLDTVVNNINHSSWGTKIKGKGGGTPGTGASVSGSNSRKKMPVQLTNQNYPAISTTGETTNNVTINLSISNASDNEAQLFAKKVKEILANDNSVLAIGKS
jgi:murein DD-endopeptidase MepM/ murein hydrolase activator NlpD